MVRANIGKIDKMRHEMIDVRQEISTMAGDELLLICYLRAETEPYFGVLSVNK